MVLAGALIPVVLLAVAIAQDAPDVPNLVSLVLYAIAATLALVGAYVFDELWITAGQAVPLS